MSEFAYPVRSFAADLHEEALSFAEDGGIAVQPVAVGYMVLGRRRRLTEWAISRGFRHHDLQLQVPTLTGIWHLVLTGQPARKLEAELGIGSVSELG